MRIRRNSLTRNTPNLHFVYIFTPNILINACFAVIMPKVFLKKFVYSSFYLVSKAMWCVWLPTYFEAVILKCSVFIKKKIRLSSPNINNFDSARTVVIKLETVDTNDSADKLLESAKAKMKQQFFPEILQNMNINILFFKSFTCGALEIMFSYI